MQNETDTKSTLATEPRKLEKPTRETQEMNREELVTYANEAGGGGITTVEAP